VADFIARVFDCFDVRGIALALFARVAKHLYQSVSGFTSHSGHLPKRSKIIFLDGHYADPKKSHALIPFLFRRRSAFRSQEQH
jgi:hypothetical protein